MQLTVKDVVELLNVSEKTVYRWINGSKLPGYRLSGQYRFNRAELLEWATSNKMQVSPRIFEEADAATTPPPDLVDVLQGGGIYYRLSGADKTSVLRDVVEHLRLPEEVDRKHLLQILRAREALESTGVGDGIAIPHARNPVVLHVPKPMLSLSFLEKPIEYGALDGKPVHVLLTVISPTLRGHLQIMSRLAASLRDVAFKSLLLRQAGREDILDGLRRTSQHWNLGPSHKERA